MNLTENVFKVDEYTWNNFTAEAKVRYNNVYSKMIGEQSSLIHPKAFPMPFEQWQLLVHNVSYIAAKNEFDKRYRHERTAISKDSTIDKLIFLGVSNQ